MAYYPVPILPAAINANPQIPDDLDFWGFMNLHTITHWNSNGTIDYHRSSKFRVQSGIMGDTNFWIRGNGEPYVTNFDKMGHGIKTNTETYPSTSLEPANSHFKPVDCETCFESSGTVGSGFLQHFKMSTPTQTYRPASDSYDYWDFILTSSRITTYGNRVPVKSRLNGPGLGIDHMTYMNGIPAQLILGKTVMDDNDVGSAGQWFKYDYIPSTMRTNSLIPDGIHSTPIFKAGWGGGTPTTHSSIWPSQSNPVSNPRIYKDVTSYQYGQNNVYDYFGWTYNPWSGASNQFRLWTQQLASSPTDYNQNVNAFYSRSPLYAEQGYPTTHEPLFYSTGVTSGSTGSYSSDMTNLGVKHLFHSNIFYITDTASFNRMFHNNTTDLSSQTYGSPPIAIADPVGSWPGNVMYFMTSSSHTTRANGDWMPEGSRTKAESLALALNFYGQFWGVKDEASHSIHPYQDLLYGSGSGIQGEFMRRQPWMKPPYSWSVDSNDDLIYTSSLCSGSRISHAHTGFLGYAEGVRLGDAPVSMSTGSGYPYTSTQRPYVENVNFLRTGSVTWRSARGFIKHTGASGGFETDTGFGPGDNNFAVGEKRGWRYDWNTWKAIGDTDMTASFIIEIDESVANNKVTQFAGHRRRVNVNTHLVALASEIFITSSKGRSTGPERMGLRFEGDNGINTIRTNKTWSTFGRRTFDPINSQGTEVPLLYGSTMFYIPGESDNRGFGNVYLNINQQNEIIDQARGNTCPGTDWAHDANTQMGRVVSSNYHKNDYNISNIGLYALESALPTFARWITFADNQRRYTKRSSCTCTEIFKWRAQVPTQYEYLYDMEFSDGFAFTAQSFLRLFMYDPRYADQGAPVIPAIPQSNYWPHSLRAVTPDELYNYTGSAYVAPGIMSASVDSYIMSTQSAFIKCADIIPGTTKTNGYVYLKSIKKRTVEITKPIHKNKYNIDHLDHQFSLPKNNVQCDVIGAKNMGGTFGAVSSGQLHLGTTFLSQPNQKYIVTASALYSGNYTGFVSPHHEAWRNWYILSSSLSGVTTKYTSSAYYPAAGGSIAFNASTGAGAPAGLCSGTSCVLYFAAGFSETYTNESQFSETAYSAVTDYPRNNWGPENSGSMIYDGMLMLENGLYVAQEGLNCWSCDEYALQSRNPLNRGVTPQSSSLTGLNPIHPNAHYTNSMNFSGVSQRYS